MPVYDAAGMRAADTWAIEEQGIPSLRLMEAAGVALAEAAAEVAGDGPIRVICGKGNNGGDGLVAARLLIGMGFQAEVLLLWPVAELAGDAAKNLGRLETEPRLLGEDSAGALADSGAIIDAIFGTGFEGAPRAPAKSAIRSVNEASAPVIAADVPSGVDASNGECEGAAVTADVTVSFHAPKVGHLVHPGKGATGELRVAAIGIPPGAPVSAFAGTVTDSVLAAMPDRGAASTKFTSGQVTVVGGSQGMTGAVCLAASAAIRAGAGYATAVVPASLEPIIEVKLTEVMSRGCADEQGSFSAGAGDGILEVVARADCVVLGNGIGRSEGAAATARAVATGVGSALVLDADGLNAHAEELESLAKREAPTILTPHEGELGRLLGRGADEVAAHRIDCALAAAERARAIVVLKGDDTLIVDGRGGEARVAINDLPSPALATAGTGDVLAGTIGALIARGADPFAAACAAVRANTRAGRIAAGRVGAAESVIAADVVEALPQGLRP